MAKKRGNIEQVEETSSNDVIKDINIQESVRITLGDDMKTSHPEEVKEKVSIIQDNPMSKKVKTELDKVNHNKNNEVLKDSDLIGNVIL
jgi:hypothetical protein